MIWHSLRIRLPKGFRRRSEAKYRLAEAYNNTFNGNATRAEAQMVLADLAQYSGWYQAHPTKVSPDVLAGENGKRLLFARIFRFLNLTDEEIDALATASRLEGVTNLEEGEI